MKKSANTKRTEKRKPPPTAWKPGQSGNPNGAPKRGESWKEVIDSVGKMFAEEVAKEVGNNDLSEAYLNMPRSIPMKRLVVMRVFSALMFDPTPGLWNPLMERVEGKIAQPIDMPWLDKARALGWSLEEAQAMYADMAQAARERLARVHANGSVGTGAIRDDSE